MLAHMNGLRVSWINSQRGMLRQLDALAALLGRGPRVAGHLATGLRGEREALFELRRMGYTVVARRWKNAKLRGDVDLIGWDGEWLCFIEVKTRTQRDAAPAEVAVDRDKQEMLQKMARAYLRAFPERVRWKVPVRFDVVSVYLQPSGTEFEVYKGAFGWA
ncbi:MAG TPA: YraN family protein [Edaphobacter sp.]|nr:YraN family protein [Edaphobacter sp.]